MFPNPKDFMNAAINGSSNSKKITGKVILMKKNVLEFNDVGATILDNALELLGSGVTLQLISAVHGDPANGLQGKVGKPANLEQWITLLPPLTAGETPFKVSFEWDEHFGTPGAFLIKNNHSSQFFLKSLTLQDVPGHGEIHFVCNSWVYPTWRYKNDRIFFSNKTYLPGETPAPLKQYRESELVNMRGNGTGERKEWERIYDYAYYNDLGNPDFGESFVRPVLGGSSQYPYPRRGRTGRAPTRTDPNTESRLAFIQQQDVYVPRDERFGHVKNTDFLGDTLKAFAQILKPALESIFDCTPGEFDTFKDVNRLYEGGFKLPGGPLVDVITANIPKDLLEEIFQTNGKNLLKYPMPQVIEKDKNAWRDDAEFAREMLAGLNPVCIRRLQEFPPASKLDTNVYGNQASSITKEHIESNLDGLSIDEAMEKNKIFILDHHDTIMPYLRKINTTSTKTYATRTLLFLKDDGTLKPIAIELSLPHPDGDKYGAINKVYTPAKDGVANSLWQLAKAYVTVNDYGHHQLISHWLNTHAVIEPFILATNRQLSTLHPINKLLVPHFRDTMNINALARQILVNAGGILEGIVFPGKYAMEMSSAIYKNWELPEQALPADLLKRGMAVEDSASPHGLRLLIEDYPYAVDGLDIWSAIKTWVQDYCSFYYKNDDAVKNDAELQAWWKELKEEGHGDKKDESWWPKMQTVKELVDTCTVTIWVASALHAAVNFGQYSYAGYMPCRPTMSRRFIPEPGTPEYAELEKNPDKVFFETVTSELKTLLGISLIEILSRHSSDEVYLGQRDGFGWTDDDTPLEAFKKFGRTLAGIEQKISDRNKNKKLKNRTGPVNVPYTLLFPTSGEGLTGVLTICSF